MKKKSIFSRLLGSTSRLAWWKGSGKSSKYLNKLGDKEFEKIVHEIFIQRGYTVSAKRSGAYEGVELILQRNKESTYVQYQHWKDPQVDVTEIGEFYVAMEVDGVKHGIVITSGEFTPDALDFSLGKSLMLINGADLSQMIEALPGA